MTDDRRPQTEKEPDLYYGGVPVYVDDRVPLEWNHGMLFVPAGVDVDALLGELPDEDPDE